MSEQKLIRIVYHYEDGSSRSIDGERLDDWIGMNNQMTSLCAARQMLPDLKKIKWDESAPTLTMKNKNDEGETDELSGLQDQVHGTDKRKNKKGTGG